MRQNKIIMVADNCTKSAATVTAYNANELTLKALKSNVPYVFNEHGKIITTQAEANLATHFAIGVKQDTDIIYSGYIRKQDLTSIKAFKPSYFLGDSIVAGDVTGLLAATFVPTPGATYALGVTIRESNPTDSLTTNTASYTLPTVGTNLKGLLFTNLAAMLVSTVTNAKYISALAHTDAASAGAVTVTINTGAKTGSFSSGTLVAGDYIAHAATVPGDARIQPRGVYRVALVDGTIFTLETAWQAENIATTVVNKVLLDDADEWGIIIKSKRQIVRTKDITYVLSPKLDVVSEGFENKDILFQGSAVRGSAEEGFYGDVNYNQETSIVETVDGNFFPTATAGYYYSKINIVYSNNPKGQHVKEFSEGIITCFLQGPTEAELIAGTEPTYLSNAVTGTGFDTSAEGAFINALNFLAISNGLFSAAANTVNNGRNALTPVIDF